MINKNSVFYAKDYSKDQVFVLGVIGEAVPNACNYELQLTFYTGYQGIGKMVWFDTFVLEDYTLEDVEDLQEMLLPDGLT